MARSFPFLRLTYLDLRVHKLALSMRNDVRGLQVAMRVRKKCMVANVLARELLGHAAQQLEGSGSASLVPQDAE
jgi:hypothetical protein